MASSSRLFVYGTLMNERVRTCVLRAAVSSAAPALVRGYKRRRVRGAAYPAAVPASASDTIPGVLLDGITAAHFEALVAYEGPEYDAAQVVAEGPAGPVEARMFVAKDPAIVDDAVEWSLEAFERDDLAAFLADEFSEGGDGAC